MGMFFKIVSDCSCGTGSSNTVKPVSAPDPKNFKILEAFVHGDYTLLKIQYPDCTNYEGQKILLYKSPLSTLASVKTLDPHFCDSSSHISPIARFEPTPRGWMLGRRLIQNLVAVDDVVCK